MVNLYEVLNIPENADRLSIERAIRLARNRGDVDERILQLASNYLLDDKRRAQYHKHMGIKIKPQERSSLAVGTDWRYVGGGIALALILFLPLLFVMFGQQKATEQLYQQQDGELHKAQEAMEKAWSTTPAPENELKHQAVERQLNDILEKNEENLQQLE